MDRIKERLFTSRLCCVKLRKQGQVAAVSARKRQGISQAERGRQTNNLGQWFDGACMGSIEPLGFDGAVSGV